jgi:hypothetical protein
MRPITVSKETYYSVKRGLLPSPFGGWVSKDVSGHAKPGVAPAVEQQV